MKWLRRLISRQWHPALVEAEVRDQATLARAQRVIDRAERVIANYRAAERLIAKRK